MLTVGLLTGYRLFRHANLTLDVLLLAGGAGLLMLGAAAGVWAYHTGFVTGDFEYWLMIFDLLLMAHGGLLLLTSGLGRRLQI